MRAFPFILIPLLTLAAPFMDGGIPIWAQASWVAFIGLFLLLFSPRIRLDPFLIWASFLFLFFCFFSFLPATWFGIPEWRDILITNYQFQLPSTLSPQPWITLHNIILIFALICWALFLSSFSPSTSMRHLSVRVYGGGIILLTLITLLFQYQVLPLSFWSDSNQFGPFPNRNQFANLMAISAVLIGALAYQDFKRNKSYTYLWGFGLLMILGILILNTSRAGIGLFFFGLTLWAAGYSFIKKNKLLLGILISVGCLLLSVFFLFGGTALDRIFAFLNPHSLTDQQTSGRLPIQKDTLSMVLDAPLFGVGLGNFEALFPFYQDHLQTTHLVVHPESDWLWLLSETGLFGLLSFTILIFLLLKKTFPFRTGSDRRLRLGGVIAIFIFIFHGFFDVSGHRIGTVIPILFCLWVALPSVKNPPPPHYQYLVFKSCGALLLAIGLLWLAAFSTSSQIPGPIGLEIALKQTSQSMKTGNYSQATTASSQAVSNAPLYWKSYFYQGQALLREGKKLRSARTAFRKARYLKPYSPEIAYQEGLLWLPIKPLWAITPWEQAIRLASYNQSGLFSEMLEETAENPLLQKELGKIAQRHAELRVFYLAYAPPHEALALIQDYLLLPSPPFTSEYEAGIFFKTWKKNASLEEIETGIKNRPQWIKAGWIWISGYYWQTQQHQKAYEIAFTHLTPPTLPNFQITAQSVKNAQTTFANNPKNFSAGFILLQNALNQNNHSEAKFFVEKILAQKNCPSYFYYLAGTIYGSEQDWLQAYPHLMTYHHNRQKE